MNKSKLHRGFRKQYLYAIICRFANLLAASLTETLPITCHLQDVISLYGGWLWWFVCSFCMAVSGVVLLINPGRVTTIVHGFLAPALSRAGRCTSKLYSLFSLVIVIKASIYKQWYQATAHTCHPLAQPFIPYPNLETGATRSTAWRYYYREDTNQYISRLIQR